MIHNISAAPAAATPDSGKVVRHTPFGDVEVPADWMTASTSTSGPVPSFAALFGAASRGRVPAVRRIHP